MILLHFVLLTSPLLFALGYCWAGFAFSLYDDWKKAKHPILQLSTDVLEAPTGNEPEPPTPEPE